MTDTYLGSIIHRQNAREAGKKGSARWKEIREERIRSYEKTPKRCLAEGCSNTIPYDGHAKRKFCSKSCSAKTGNLGKVKSEETRRKIAGSVKVVRADHLVRKTTTDRKRTVRTVACVACRRIFETFSKTRGRCEDCAKAKVAAIRSFVCKFCSKENEKLVKNNRDPVFCDVTCQRNYMASYMKGMTDEERLRRSKIGKKVIQEQMEQGRWKGWYGRGEPSFPEKFVMNLLANDGLTFEQEKHCAGFSIDFAFPELMIALEVDGKQHDYPVNAERDKRKEIALAGEGWSVLRLRWFGIRSKSGHKKVMDQYVKIRDVLQEKRRSEAKKL